MRDKCLTIEQRIAASGHSVAELCDQAGINRATWQRWKSGEREPMLSHWNAIEMATDAMDAMVFTGKKPGKVVAAE